MFMCKEGEGQKCKNPFVRTVTAVPFPMMVLAFNYTLDDLVRFCTGQKHCVFGVDPTFNLGNFDVTVTTYQHLLLQLKDDQSQKSPTLLGPIFIHVCKDFAAYHFFTSFLVGQRPQLRSIKAFGTDGESALENALESSFVGAQHVRCFLHFKGNIEHKLNELKIPTSIKEEIVKDVMGSPSQLQHGLVDAKSVEQLDSLLLKFKARWNELEQPYNSPPFFHTWFVRHCRDVVAKCMLPEIRTMAGLGCPPVPYYTNEVESKNKVLKDEVEHKKSEFPDFIDKMRSLLEEQKREIECALIDKGQYRLREEYRYLKVESSSWFKLNFEQRQRKINRLMKASVEISSSDTTTENPLHALEISNSLKVSMWEKAQDLLKDDNSIVKAPGSDTSWMVRSYSNEKPHYVQVAKSGNIVCDDQCLSYNSLKICAHSLALATQEKLLDKFLTFHQAKAHSPNFTALSEKGRPNTAGKKFPRRGISKKQSAQIKSMIQHAEESELEWQRRGEGLDLESKGLSSSHLDPSPLQGQGSFDFPLHSYGSSPPPCGYAVHNQWTPYVSTSLVLNQGAGNITNAGVLYAAGNSPPPLIHASPGSSSHSSPPQLVPPGQPQLQQKLVETPFWLAFIFGNVSRCNGCKGKILRDENKRPLPPPDDIVIGHKEFIIFSNPRSGLFEQSKEKRNVYYHVRRCCILPYFIDFDCQHITIPENVKAKLEDKHKELLYREFNLIL